MLSASALRLVLARPVKMLTLTFGELLCSCCFGWQRGTLCQTRSLTARQLQPAERTGQTAGQPHCKLWMTWQAAGGWTSRAATLSLESVRARTWSTGSQSCWQKLHGSSLQKGPAESALKQCECRQCRCPTPQLGDSSDSRLYKSPVK